MITMQDARKKAYNIFPSDLEGDSLTRQVNIVKYIDHLGQVTHTSVDGWPVMDIFVNPETKLLFTDRSRINKLFFEFREKVPADATREEALSEAISQSLHNSCSWMLERAIGNATMDVSRSTSHIREMSNGLRQHQGDLIKHTATLTGLKQIKTGGNTEMTGSITKVLLKRFYTLHDIQNSGMLRLKTQPITLSFMNKRQDATQVVPMGWYIVEIVVNENGFLVTHVNPGGENPLGVGSSRYWHPHVGSDGTVCYGNMLTEYNVAAASFNIAKVAEITEACLVNYNDGNPHLHLYKFEEAFQAKRFADPHAIFPDQELDEDEPEEPEYEDEPDDSESEREEIPSSASVNLTAEGLRAARDQMFGRPGQPDRSGTNPERPPQRSQWTLIDPRERVLYPRHAERLEGLANHHAVYNISEEDGQRFEYRRNRQNEWVLHRHRRRQS